MCTTTMDHSHRVQRGQATMRGRGQGLRGWAGAQQGGPFPCFGLGSGAGTESGPQWQVSKRGWTSHQDSSQDSWGHSDLGGEGAAAHGAAQREDRRRQMGGRRVGRGRKHCGHGVTPNSDSTVASPASRLSRLRWAYSLLSPHSQMAPSHHPKQTPHHTEHPSPFLPTIGLPNAPAL